MSAFFRQQRKFNIGFIIGAQLPFDIGVSAKKCENGLNQIGVEPGSLRVYSSPTSTETTQKASEFLQTDTKFRFMPPSFAMMSFTSKVLRMIKQILIL